MCFVQIFTHITQLSNAPQEPPVSVCVLHSHGYTIERAHASVSLCDCLCLRMQGSSVAALSHRSQCSCTLCMHTNYKQAAELAGDSNNMLTHRDQIIHTNVHPHTPMQKLHKTFLLKDHKRFVFNNLKVSWEQKSLWLRPPSMKLRQSVLQISKICLKY